MTLEQKEQILRSLKIGLISASLTAVFMYFFYYRGWQSILAGLCIGFSIPLLLNTYTNLFANKYLRHLNLILLLLINTIVHVLVLVVVSLFFVGLVYMKGDFNLIFNNSNFFYSYYLMVGIGFGLILSLFFNFFYIINTLVGPNILGKLFIGVYRNPIEVDRVFMFIDIKSSTAIAEQIGHLKFLSLVNDFFYDIADPVKKTKGEIYKYVGDEAIITWKTKHATSDANCIRCFLMIEKAIQDKSQYYLKTYGIIPKFKAGLHGGISITGELGYTRREIAYMGDVLNTTSRIEKRCTEFEKRILISEDLVFLLKESNSLNFLEVGNVKLRGKEKDIKLFTI